MELSRMGIIGNCRSAALISENGSIVWSCLPDFDSPSVFAKILDEDNGGELSVIPEGNTQIQQTYLGDTNILRTLFECPSGSFEIIDFMPIYSIDDMHHHHPPEIYRLIRVINGKPSLKIHYNPKLNYAKSPIRSIASEEYIKSSTAGGEYHSIYLYSNIPLAEILEERLITLSGDVFLLISHHQKLIRVDMERVSLEFERTRVYWMNWVNRTQVYPLYQKEIIRSALVLKLLTYRKSGAVIAAVTTSIPESIGKSRNWDYRYCWLRDASMIIQTLWEIRHTNTAREFLRFLLGTMVRKADTLQIMYGIHGEKDLTEKSLHHLKGYKNSRPVRTGNAAYLQKQNDIYGVLMDLIHSSFVHFPSPLNVSEELWTTVRYIMKTVENNWKKPDRGIWEIRSARRHYVFSKALSWVAADRGVQLARLLKRNEYIDLWTEIRDTIKNDIESRGWNNDRQAYTQSYGSNDLDASVLLLEKIGYCQASDPRYVSTVRIVYRELCRNGLMYRYRNNDDFGSPNSAFIICTFWMIDGLYKTGEKALAVEMFKNLLSSANHLGLYSEDMDFETRELLGNFPQGYSHLALINTAILLNEKNSSDIEELLCVY